MKYLPIAVLLCLMSCGNSDKPKGTSTTVQIPIYDLDEKRKSESSSDWWKSKFDIVLIDGCEYLAYRLNDNSGLMTHKGNCKNPIHNYAK